MPKRKKRKYKTGGPDLPPLQFVESPLYQSPPVLSPEFGATNPITARAVAVEDIEDLSWVTPQFENERPYSRHCAKQTSRRMTRLRQRSETYRFDQHLNDVASKYKPLSFVQSDSPTRNRKRSSNKAEALVSPNHNSGKKDLENCELDGDLPEDSFPNSFKISTPVIIEGQEINPENSLLPSKRGDNLDIESRLANSSLSTNRGKFSCDVIEGNNDGDCHELCVIFGKVKDKRLSLFESSSSPPPSPIPPVLVADTPECDYGLTMRQRQMKYLLRSQQKR